MKENWIKWDTLRRFVFRNINIRLVAIIAGLVVLLFIGKKQCVCSVICKLDCRVSFSKLRDRLELSWVVINHALAIPVVTCCNVVYAPKLTCMRSAAVA